MKKAQGALEFLITYGWAFVVVLVLVGAMASTGVVTPEQLQPDKCVSPPGFSCEAHSISENEQNFKFKNKLGHSINIKNSSLAVGASDSSSACSSQSNIIGADEDFLITCNNQGLKDGEKVKSELEITYYKSSSDESFAKSVKASIVSQVYKAETQDNFVATTPSTPENTTQTTPPPTQNTGTPYQETVLSFSGGSTAFTVKGTDVIYLAGRTDVTIPPLDTSYVIARHGSTNYPSYFLIETIPKALPVSAGSSLSFSASGGVDYWLDPSAVFYSPDGNAGSISNIRALGGISAYKGPWGSIVGVFTDGSNPQLLSPPSNIDYNITPINSTSFSPALRQVFFIGDGLTGTNSGERQTFLVPSGATKLYIGIADSWNFNGYPAAYEDNNGEFSVIAYLNE